MTRVRRELASTGRLDLVARAELLRCAAQAASLALTQACPPLRPCSRMPQALKKPTPITCWAAPWQLMNWLCCRPRSAGGYRLGAVECCQRCGTAQGVEDPLRAWWPLAPCSVQGRPGAKWLHWQ
jgi:hypothetical protein